MLGFCSFEAEAAYRRRARWLGACCSEGDEGLEDEARSSWTIRGIFDEGSGVVRGPVTEPSLKRSRRGYKILMFCESHRQNRVASKLLHMS